MNSIKKIEEPRLPLYSPVLSVQREGWCVYMFLATDDSQIVSGPFTDKAAAKVEADRLNDIHKEETA